MNGDCDTVPLTSVRNGDIGTVLAVTCKPVAAVAIKLDRDDTIICIGFGGIKEASPVFTLPIRL